MRTAGKVICLIALCAVGSSCKTINPDYFDSGVSLTLAQTRVSTISDISYDITFDIPSDHAIPVKGDELITFNAKHLKYDLLVDFRETIGMIDEVTLNGRPVKWQFKNDHIILPRRLVSDSNNELRIRFTAGDLSLNRNEKFMYTLFVPDRAATAFPCFDQPDLKATFSLTLRVDTGWNAIANNPMIEQHIEGSAKTLRFGPGKPISTYLFAFAAGEFEVIEETIEGVTMQMLHRETRHELVDANTKEIFNLHLKSIKWLEEYTGIEYPFDKFGFILIPSFQYGGMEHPGSIYYKGSSLLLEENASVNQRLARAGLIAHETSHIWFGDLVTMDWFNDVWLKEVFAGFFSDKITNPSFPEINHDLRFLLSRYPAAYSVDRTQGSNPIIQELVNMKDAGTLYGAIIYNKAPVVMKQLELMVGEKMLRQGLQEYLQQFSYGNAKWDDLVNILNSNGNNDLNSWSNVWVREAGRPEISTSVAESPMGEMELNIVEKDPANMERHWPQQMKTLVIYSDEQVLYNSEPSSTAESIPIGKAPLGYIPAADGITYGLIRMQRENIIYLLNNLSRFSDPLTRGVVMLNSWENMVEGVIDPTIMLDAVIERAYTETETLLIAQLRGYITSLYWNHLDRDERAKYSSLIETLVIEKINETESLSEKKSWFNTLVNISQSMGSLDLIHSVWMNRKPYMGIKFGEPDYISMAFNLALKRYPGFMAIINKEADMIENNDRREEFLFIAQALDSSVISRDAFFDSLKNAENRAHEPWVTRSLGFLHHPLYSDYSEKYIPASLELLEEIQQTGDIFFPGQWITATLDGHNTESSWKMVSDFLEINGNYPANLRLKILQASDHLYRRFSNSSDK